jgi:hypothetical protein
VDTANVYHIAATLYIMRNAYTIDQCVDDSTVSPFRLTVNKNVMNAIGMLTLTKLNKK